MTEREATYWLILGALFAAIVLYAVGAALPAEGSPHHHDAGQAQIGTAIHAAIHPATCRYSRSDGRRGWTPAEVARTIRCAARRWTVPGGPDKAVDVASCESHLDERAYNPGGYAGVFQQATRYWDGRFRVFAPDRFDLRPSVFNGRTNVVVSVKQAHAGGWGPWAMGACA